MGVVPARLKLIGVKAGNAPDGSSEGESGQTPSAYNSTSVIYTGIKNAELGF